MRLRKISAEDRNKQPGVLGYTLKRHQVLLFHSMRGLGTSTLLADKSTLLPDCRSGAIRKRQVLSGVCRVTAKVAP
jgi:hypothetical protein